MESILSSIKLEICCSLACLVLRIFRMIVYSRIANNLLCVTRDFRLLKTYLISSLYSSTHLLDAFVITSCTIIIFLCKCESFNPQHVAMFFQHIRRVNVIVNICIVLILVMHGRRLVLRALLFLVKSSILSQWFWIEWSCRWLECSIWRLTLTFLSRLSVMNDRCMSL